MRINLHSDSGDAIDPRLLRAARVTVELTLDGGATIKLTATARTAGVTYTPDGSELVIDTEPAEVVPP